MISEWLERNIDRVRTRANGGWRAQSEVLGVALLTAIVVILVATVALFLFTDFTSDQSEERVVVSVESDMTSENLTIQHAGGDSFEASDISVIVQGDTNYEMGLDDFDQTDGNTFSPGSVWRETGLNNTGNMRLLVIAEESNTILHDQFYEITVQDVRLLVNGSDHAAEVTGVNDADLPPGEEDVRRVSYTRQVQYNTGEGWINVSEGVENMEFDPDSGTLQNLPDEGVLEATSPEGTSEEIRVRTWFSTPVGNDTYSNWVTVTVNDAEVGADVTFEQEDVYASASGDDLVVDWQATNTALLDIPVQFDAAIEVTNETGTVIHSGVQEDITIFEDDTVDRTLTVPDMDPTTEEVEVAITGTSEYPWVTGDSANQTFDAASFNVTEFDATFDGDSGVLVDYNVTNTGDWSAQRNVAVDVTTFDDDGNELDSGTTLFEDDVSLESGESLDANRTYDITNNATSLVNAEITTPDDADSDTVDIDPAEFLLNSVEAELVSTADTEDYIAVDYEVENPGDLPDMQDITLDINTREDPVDRDSDVLLAGGNSTNGTLNTTAFSGTGTYQLTVSTDDDSASDTISIQGPSYNVTILDAYPDGEGNLVTEYTINNTGDLEGNVDVDYMVAGDVRHENNSVTVPGDVLITHTAVAEVEAADINEDGDVPVKIDVTDPAAATFATDETDVEVDDPTYEVDADFALDGEQIVVEFYNVTNTGDVDGESEDIRYTVEVTDVQAGSLSGNDVGTTVVNVGDIIHDLTHTETIGAGESVTGSFTGDDALDLGSAEGLDLSGVLAIDVEAAVSAGEGRAWTDFENLEPALFDVQPINGPDVSFADGSVTVDYTVENTGGLEGTQDIEFLVTDALGETTADTNGSVTLAPGETISGSFTYNNVDVTSEEVTVAVSSANDESAHTFNVQPATFQITGASGTFDSGSETATISYDVTNTGDFTASKEIIVDSQNEQTSTITEVAPGETVSESQTIDITHQGPQNIAVYVTDEGYDEAFIDPVPSYFSVTSVDANYDTNTQQAVVQYEIQNTGDFADTQTISIESNNQDTTRSLQLGPGESSGTLTDRVGVDEGGDQTIWVVTDDEDNGDGIFVEGPDFQVDVNTVTYDEVDEEATVDYTITNQGDLDDTQTINIYTDPSNKGGSTSTQVNLDPAGDATTDQRTISIYDAGTIRVYVASADNSAYGDINVDPANIEFTSTNFPSSVDGDASDASIDVSFTIENKGQISDSTYVDLHRSYNTDNREDSGGVYTLGAGETASGTLSFDVGRESGQWTTLETTTNGNTVREFVHIYADPLVNSDSLSVDADTGSIGSCGGWWDPRPEASVDATLSVDLDDPSFEFNNMYADFSVDTSFASGGISGGDYTKSSTTITHSASGCSNGNIWGSATVDVNYEINPGPASGSLSESDGF